MEITVTEDNFQSEVAESDIPVLVDFWAEWCMPCKMIAPVLERLAEQYQGKLTIGRLNVDDYPDLAFRYNITGIPSLLLFKGGEVINQNVGAAPAPTIEGIFKDHI